MTLRPATGTLAAAAAAALLATGIAGCSIKKFAVNKLGDAIASSGSTYESDDDPELIGEALPFSLKLLESLLTESPRHEGMLLAACKGFASYSYGYVQSEAEQVSLVDLEHGLVMQARARRLYLRALGYGLRGLEVRHAGLTARLAADPRVAVAGLETRDVPLLYWTAASLGLAISISRDDAAMLARLPEVEAMLDRALTLDESWEEGALHEFAIVFGGTRPAGPPATADDLKRHFDRARALSSGRRASLYLAYAESVSVPKQDAAEFRSMLDQALAVDPEAAHDIRLANILAQRRARWLMGRTEELILEAPSPAAAKGGTP